MLAQANKPVPYIVFCKDHTEYIYGIYHFTDELAIHLAKYGRVTIYNYRKNFSSHVTILHPRNILHINGFSHARRIADTLTTMKFNCNKHPLSNLTIDTYPEVFI